MIGSLPIQLLKVALELAGENAVPHEQARHRRAVSTAYYALFHLLVAETAQNWGQIETQPAFGRLLDHGKMKSACEKKTADVNRQLKAEPVGETNLEVERQVQSVATAFRDLYQSRLDADYDTAKEWTQTGTLAVLKQATESFEQWQSIRSAPEAQRFLFSFLAKDR